MYSDINRCFIQYMLKQGIVSRNDADKFITEMLVHTKEIMKSLETVVAEINDKITDHLFRLVFRKCEITGIKMCCLINTGNDDISRISGEFTVVHHQYFKNILEEIMLSDSKRIKLITCLNLASTIKGSVSKDALQKKIDKLCQIGYLIKEDGYIYLGARSILEYEHYFQQEFKNRMTTCSMCTEYVYFGQICLRCNEIVHNHCLDMYKYKGKKCPVCKEAWEPAEGRNYEEQEDTDEEMEVTAVESDDEPEISQRSSKRRK